ncbi:MAG: flagellar basal body rod protein FlgB [Firmicutes bacterium]|jgi:flagellar basal-body rod protein FlgB|nr:flagellar basal body rod protein FlgB [Bacillota bacterium]
MADWLSSNSMLMMESSMRYLWTNQAVMLDNIVNAETPNYKPKYVTFEDSFRAKLQAAAMKKNGKAEQQAMRQAVSQATPSIYTADNATTRMDGNGVNVAEQEVELVRNTYQMQYVLDAINSDFSLLRTAITG